MKNKTAPEVHHIGLSSNPKPSTPTIRHTSIPPQPTNNNIRSTQSSPTILYPLGTVIRHKYKDDNIFLEGKVTAYDTTNNLYHIKYREGDTDDFNYDELKKYRKVQKKYQKVLKLKKIGTQILRVSTSMTFSLSLQKPTPTK